MGISHWPDDAAEAYERMEDRLAASQAREQAYRDEVVKLAGELAAKDAEIDRLNRIKSRTRQEELVQQLAEREKQIVMLREALDMVQWGDFHFDHNGDGQHYCPECGNLTRQSHAVNCPIGIALAATNNLSNYILYDADPIGEVRSISNGGYMEAVIVWKDGCMPAVGTLLYKAKEWK